MGFALTLNNSDGWEALGLIVKEYLDEKQRAALAFSVLQYLHEDNILAVAEAALPENTPPPIAPFVNQMDEASFWADVASEKALEAYCLASFNRMSNKRKSDFLNFVTQKVAA